ncbi:tonsoku-like protein [Eurytemora carolleeae]|uniref:tonsoku-like protein n=1 Tax=Eurytemora carolleeae TaxID=1294199 RepID=UPI000C781EFA|nr:tonsoku-like protein [Eurytemora carolleeae]|eukprot:XP_023339194.1 tonsoku-like protein [Eurytemora affinis]
MSGNLKVKSLLRDLESAQRKEKWREAGEIANQLGFLFSKRKDYDDAIKYHKEDLGMCRNLEDTDGMAQAYKNICEVQVLKNEFAEAEKTIYKCLKLTEATGDYVNKERSFKMLGYIYLNQYDVENQDPSLLSKCIKFIKKCFKLYEEPGLQGLGSELNVMKGRAHENLCFAHILSGNVEEGSQHLKNAERFLKENKIELGKLYHGFSANLISAGAAEFTKYSQKALVYVDKAIKNLKSRDEEYIMAVVTRAKILLLNKQFKDAKSSLLLAYEVDPKNENVATFIKVVKRILKEEEILLSGTDHKSYELIGDLIGGTSIEPILNNGDKKAFAYLSIQYYQNSLEALLKDGEHDKQKASALHSSIAQCYEDARDYEMALTKYKEVLQMEIGRPRDQSITQSHIVNNLECLKAEEAIIIREYENWISLSKRAGLKFEKDALQEFCRFLKEADRDSEYRRRSGELDLVLDKLGEDQDYQEEEDISVSQKSGNDLLAGVEVDTNVGRPKRNTGKHKFTKDNKGQWNLHRLVRLEGREEAIKSDIERGHPLEVTDNCGWTPLGDCMERGILAYVKLLVEAGADIDKRQPEDDTPLILASRAGFLDIIEYLLSAGADPTLPNKKGLTSIALLRRHRRDLEYEKGEENEQNIRDLDRLIMIIEEKYRSLGREVDSAVAPSTCSNSLEQSSQEMSPCVPKKKGKMEQLRELRQNREKKAAKSLKSRFGSEDDLKSSYQSLGSRRRAWSPEPFQRSRSRSNSPDTTFKSGRRFSSPDEDGGSSDDQRSPSNRMTYKTTRESSDDEKERSSSPILSSQIFSFKSLKVSQSRGAGKLKRKSSFPTSTEISCSPDHLPEIPTQSWFVPDQLPDTSTQISCAPEYLPDIPDYSQIHNPPAPDVMGADVYQNVMEGLRHPNRLSLKPAQKLVPRRDIDDSNDFMELDDSDWLVDDLKEGQLEKERKKRERSSEEKRPSKLKRRRGSKENAISLRLDQDLHDDPDDEDPEPVLVDELPSPHSTQYSTISRLNKLKRRTQPKIGDVFPRVPGPSTSIEDSRRTSGESEYRSNPGESWSTPRESWNTPRESWKAPRESDWSTQQTPVIHPQEKHRTVKVQMENKSLLIPIKEKNLTVAWLIGETAARYGRSEGITPATVPSKF